MKHLVFLSAVIGFGISQAHADCGTERVITLLGTNDIHGSIDPTVLKSGDVVGGMGFLGGYTKAVRRGMQEKLGSECSGSLLVDGGDQFQGTLLSNFSEGQLMFDLMGEMGYDAIVPGNHDYDFGPLGWLYDQVEPGKTSHNPREVIERLAASAKFPLLSANTYFKASLKDISGRAASIQSAGCTSEKILDWSGAKRPDFLQSHIIKNVAGVRVAIIGLDNVDTATTTTPANVTDLCFRDPATEYLALRKELQGQADVFVILVHDGDASGSFRLTNLVKSILAADPDGVDAVIGGHTHMVNELQFAGVPAIQSGADGQRFGRIDLVFDTAKKKVNRARTKFFAGAYLLHHSCDAKTSAFCTYATKDLKVEKNSVQEDASVTRRVSDANALLTPMADRKLGRAERELTRDRYLESALGNILADGMREVADVPIAFVNTGGIRTNIPAGEITYKDLFRVQPFNNHAVVLGPMRTSAIVRLLTRSVQSCGGYGALVVSGLRVTFSKDCSVPQDGADKKAKLLTVHLLNGEKIFDGTAEIPEISEKEFLVATFDFLSQGGSGYDAFKGFPIVRDLGIYREVLADRLATHPGKWTGAVDGRWKNVREDARPE